MSSQVSITQLEQEFQELSKEWERFFAGIIRVPPEKVRIAYGQQLRRITEAGGVGGIDQYRLQQLQHKFTTYSQNWERLLREREEGRGRSLAYLRASARRGAPPAQPSEPDTARRPPVHQGKGDDLYEQFISAKRRLGQPASLKREAFQAQIESQRAQIEARLGHKVRFEVVVEGDKVKLTARKKGASEQE